MADPVRKTTTGTKGFDDPIIANEIKPGDGFDDPIIANRTPSKDISVVKPVIKAPLPPVKPDLEKP